MTHLKVCLRPNSYAKLEGAGGLELLERTQNLLRPRGSGTKASVSLVQLSG